MKKISLCSLLLVAVSSCNIAETSTSFTKLNNVEIKYNNIVEKDENYYEFLNKLSLFSAEISERMYLSKKDESDTLSMSPFSIYMALSMLVETLENEALDEILNALDMSYKQVKVNTKKLILSSLKEKIDSQTNKQIMKLDINNSAWIDDDFTSSINNDVLKSLQDNYLCQVNEVDYSDENTNKVISDYVAEKTNNLLKPEFNIDPLTVMVLLNTLYFKDSWTDVVEGLSLTESNYQFINKDNSITSMQLNKGLYMEGRKFTSEAYDAFYTKTQYNYKMSFIVPNENYSIDDIFTKEVINQVNKQNYEVVDKENKIIYNTRCFFPSFEASGKYSLNNILKDDFGIKTIYTKPDFSKFTSEEGIVVSDIMHESKVVVDKKGIEAAAYTAIFEVAEGAPSDEYRFVYEDFIVDKAFGFILSDYDDNILFTGVVGKI